MQGAECSWLEPLSWVPHRGGTEGPRAVGSGLCPTLLVSEGLGVAALHLCSRASLSHLSLSRFLASLELPCVPTGQPRDNGQQ